jgi:hypothetical protein
LFDWLVTGHVIERNPAHSVRGPTHRVKHGKMPVLDASEARALIDSIDVTTAVGLRDRALIGLMVYSFARVGAATAMKIEDVYMQNRRLWVRLHEKGDKRHEMPWHYNLETCLHAYIDGCGLGLDPKGSLFRTIGRGNGQLVAAATFVIDVDPQRPRPPLPQHMQRRPFASKASMRSRTRTPNSVKSRATTKSRSSLKTRRTISNMTSLASNVMRGFVARTVRRYSTKVKRPLRSMRSREAPLPLLHGESRRRQERSEATGKRSGPREEHAKSHSVPLFTTMLSNLCLTAL